MPANFESQTARLFERPSEQSSKRTGKGEGAGGIVCMVYGVLIGALLFNQGFPMQHFPLFSSDVVRGGSGAVRRIDVHLCSDVLPRGQDIQVGQ